MASLACSATRSALQRHILISLLFCYFAIHQAFAHGGPHHGHQHGGHQIHHHHGHYQPHRRDHSQVHARRDDGDTVAAASGSNGNNSLSSSSSTMMSLEEAKDIVAQFQKAMSAANRHILRNPQPNNYQIINKMQLERTRRMASHLPYGGVQTNGSSLLLSRRDSAAAAANHTTTWTNGTFTGKSYTVPPEVLEAARLVAQEETSSIKSSSSAAADDDYASQVAALKAKYKARLNQTNVMAQRLKQPSGLVEVVPPNELPVTTHNGTIVAGSDGARDEKRSTDDEYWQETMTHLGTAPYASAGYKVWRNVKDYGAKGDGITDDTAAIMRAMSDGGRCGADCPSSTMYPATVYFPSGTYLVSSSITQYYNTEIIGNPLLLPTILASSSFVGLGVIGSNVYTGDSIEWYLNTNNFLRSVRNLIIDVRRTPQDASVCGIHWQVAQGTSLENIYFYATDPDEVPSTTQQGIYMENGSGGFVGDLYFIGGSFGAFFGNQQFTSSGLYFKNCRTGLQIAWDWGWTMQNLVFEDVDTGVVIVGGAGGPQSTGQGVGSLVLTDTVMSNAVTGIQTSLFADNSTAFLLLNAAFSNVANIATDSASGQVLYPGSASAVVKVDSWGFGKVANATGETGFVNGHVISTPSQRPASLVQQQSSGDTSTVLTNQNFYFTRRRPSYATLGNSQLMDVKALGAAGDGTTDDTAVLNHILSAAANISAIVYFPQGIYVISDTLYVPVGSRIMGQAWPQIMATGAKFQDMTKPRAAVQVGSVGSIGSVEIQSILFTVRGPTAGAVLVEWNVHESSQGSAGLWDSHFRVGGAAGSNLQVDDCPTTNTNTNCIAASLLMHITQKASAYLENVWLWVADHDIESQEQTQINVFAGRGLLVESQGPTWLWGTSAEHSVLYQYQLSGAQNIVMGLLQTESPYFQTTPAAPAPFQDGLVFANDPSFSDCGAGSEACAMAWAVRMVDSSNVTVLNTGLYTWFRDYDQTCVNSGTNDCQQRLFYVEQSYDVWIYNLVTIGNVEMISPLNGKPVSAVQNRNGYASAILAWLGGANQTAGLRNFTGYQIYTLDDLTASNFPDTCKTALTATINCEESTMAWMGPSYHRSLDNDTLQTRVCDVGCGQSLTDWVTSVRKTCVDARWMSGAPVDMFGAYILYGYNETCQVDASTGEFCNDVIDSFSLGDSIDAMPTAELCSDCYLGRLRMMQASPYSIFNVYSWYQGALESAVTRCALSPDLPTSTQPALIPSETLTPLCLSGKTYVTQLGDSCNSIATTYSVSSAALFSSNPMLLTNCTRLEPDISLCIPLSCQTYMLRSDDDCISASVNAGVSDITVYNTWINSGCDNLHEANTTLGSVLCASPMGGTYMPGTPTNTSVFPGAENTGYGTTLAAPPDEATAAPGTTLQCSKWHVASSEDTCASMTLDSGISLSLFMVANPSINNTVNCTSSIVAGDAYCVTVLRPPSVDETTYSWQSFGCWNNTDPVIPVLGEANFTDVNGMTVEECAKACFQSYYSFFGIQGSDNCFCGSKVAPNSRQVAQDQCNLICAGNSSEICGGSDNIMSLFGATDADPDVPSSSTTTVVGTATSRTSSAASSSSTTVAATSTSITTHCIGGTTADGVSGNFLGLCSYSCDYDHCPDHVCVCTRSASAAVATPTASGQHGCPDAGVDEGSVDYAYYVDLCDFTCSHGYCPEGACVYC